MFGEVLGSRLGLKHLAENAWECVFAISDVSKRILKCFFDFYNSFEGVNDLKLSINNLEPINEPLFSTS